MLNLMILAWIVGTVYYTASTPVAVENILADDTHCGKNFSIGDGKPETYRLLVPDSPPNASVCPLPAGVFNCSLRFKVQSAERGQTSPLYEDICVDFSRILVYGNNSRLEIGYNSRLRKTLHSGSFPLKKKYVSGVKCYGAWATVYLTFTMPCNVSSLRDSFVSWIYIYRQPKRKLIYHLDGTCRLAKIISVATYERPEVILRSYIWEDGLIESPFEDTCSIKLETYTIGSYNSKYMICPQFNFHYKSCGLSAYYFRARFLSSFAGKFKYTNSRNGSCQSDFQTSEMDKCLEFNVLKSYRFEVRRNKTLSEAVDGIMFMEVVIGIKIVMNVVSTPRYRIENSDNSGSYNPWDDDDDDDDDDDNESLMYKLFMPVVMVFSCCACVCGLSRHNKKNQAQARAAAQPLPLENLARGPLMPAYFSGNNTGTSGITSSTTSGITSGTGRTSAPPATAPPPHYGDLSYRQPAPVARGNNVSVSPHSGYVPPSAPLLRETPLEPPPPFPSSPEQAPPAYSDLFPSKDA